MNLEIGKLNRIIEGILNNEEIREYEASLLRERPDNRVERLVSYDATNGLLIIQVIESNPNKIEGMKEFIYKLGGFTDIYFGNKPNLVRYFVLGDIENPGFFDEYPFINELGEEKFNKFLKEINYRKKNYVYLFIYYSLDHNILGVHLQGQEDNKILYYDYEKGHIVDFNKPAGWIKVYMEKIS